MLNTQKRKIQNARIDHLSSLTEREKANERAKKWFKDNRQRRYDYIKKWNTENYLKNKSYQSKYRLKLKKTVINFYSRGRNECICCGERYLEFLTINHIHNDGNKERKVLNLRGGHSFYRWLIKNDFPDGYNVMCMNCNNSHGAFGYCPHFEGSPITDHLIEASL